jgi:GTPase SAR1 family protein
MGYCGYTYSNNKGQERFNSLAVSYYRGADACMYFHVISYLRLVYDVTREDSMNALKKWISEFIRHSNISDPSNFPFVLVGNKCDDFKRRQVSKEDGILIAKQLRKYIEEFSEGASDVTFNNSVDVLPKMRPRMTSTRTNSLVNVQQSLLSQYTTASEFTETPQINPLSLIEKAEDFVEDLELSKLPFDVFLDDISEIYEDKLVPLPFFETSAKEGSRVHDVFEYVASVSEPRKTDITDNPIRLSNNPKKSSSCTC